MTIDTNSRITQKMLIYPVFLLWIYIRYFFRKYVLKDVRLTCIREHVYHSRVSPLQIDIFLHMNHAEYLVAFEYARWEMFLESGMMHASHKRHWTPITVMNSVRYKKQMMVFEKYTIKTNILYGDPCGKGIYFLQRMYNSRNQLACSYLIKIYFLKYGLDSKVFVTTDELRAEFGDYINEYAPKHEQHLTNEAIPSFTSLEGFLLQWNGEPIDR